MTVLFPAVGELIALKATLNNTAGQNCHIKLYSNAHTPANADTAASYTECTFGGYTSGGNALVGGSWTFASGNPSSATYNTQQTWTFNGTGAQTIQGYFVTQDTSTTLLYAEADPSPFTLATNGDNYNVTPAVTCT